MLRPSWLVGGQVGAERGKLTLLGGLRGAKLELKGASGAQGGSKAHRELNETHRLIGNGSNSMCSARTAALQGR